MAKRKYLFGTVSHGTMRSEDLIPSFCDIIRHLHGTLPLNLYKQVREYNASRNQFDENGYRIEGTFDDAELVSDLTDYLQLLAPPYFYFGSHPGDGADYGFWMYESVADDVKENGGIVVDDTSEVPKGFNGEVLHVSDHGNATLYYTNKRGKLRQIWGVV